MRAILILGLSLRSGLGVSGAITVLPAPAPPSDHPGFHRLETNATGVTFEHVIPATRHLTNQMLLDGSGVALGDVDGDGRVDLFLAATGGGSQLWRNEGGWRFREITSGAFPPSFASLAGDITGAAFADLTGDGSLDLVVNSHAEGIRVLLNDGHGVFRPLTFPQAPTRGGHSLALADVDGDGWVDLYVCNYRQRALMDMPSARATFSGTGAARVVATLDGRPTTAPDLTNRFIVNAAGGLDELGEADVLYRNLGGTNFIDVPWTSGAFLEEDGRSLQDAPRDWGLAAQFCDVNEDGRPDLYVCNDFQSPDRFWINESSPNKIRFRLIPRSAVRHTSLFSMGVDFGDLNRDGRPDFVVVDMLSPDPIRRLTMLDGTPSVVVNPADPLSRPQSDANTLFLQRRDGSFAEVAAFAGVMATDWSWTPAFLDVDLDGWLDLLVTAGQERGSRDLDVAEHMKVFRRSGLRTDAQIFRERQKFPRLPARLQAFRNGGGEIPAFEASEAAWGLDFSGVSHGLALGDLDGDGDLDLVVNHLNSPVGLYRNECPAPRIAIRLRGRTPNTGAIGARLRFGWGTDPVEALRHRPQSAQVFAGGRYLSSDEFTRTFACPGPGRGVLEVRWPSGRFSVLTDLAVNQRCELEEPTDSAVSPEAPGEPAERRLWFEARPTGLLSAASAVDDFALQPLLPRRQSTRTPVLAWGPSGRGSNMLWIGGASGQPLRQVSLAGTVATAVREWGPAAPTASLAIRGDDLLVAGSAGEDRSNGGASLFRLRSGIWEPIPTAVTAPGSLAMSASASAEGTWLFVGGGPMPGRYPMSSPSELGMLAEGSFVSRQILPLGIVKDSAWADLDGDGRGELVVAGEWGAPRILRQIASGWEPWDVPVGHTGEASVKLSDLTGWWQCLAVSDFDGNGRPDVVLGNWGLNSPYALFTGIPRHSDRGIRPLALFYGGGPEAAPGICLEAYTRTDDRWWPIRGRTDLAPHLPWLSERFPTHRAFVEATMLEILSDQRGKTSRLECRHLASMILLNRGGRFEIQELPAEAQLGPLMALGVSDFDGDGHLDLYGAQGFFGHNFGMAREDAGEGVFLLGRGDGTFTAIPSAEAGVRLLGEQRAALAGDLDGDGRPDLVLGIHGGPITFLLNRRP